MAKVIPFKITADHLVVNLGQDLYRNTSDCAQELVKNGAVACMPSGKWVAGKGKIRIWLEKKLALAGGQKAIVFLDYGSGFTEEALNRFTTLGASMNETRAGKKTSHSGAAQKRLGRFAAFALNTKLRDGNYSTGFLVLTRTASSGDIKLIEMIPELIEQRQGIEPQMISAANPSVEFLGNIKGSFSAIIVPSPVFGSLLEIKESLLWKMPRRAESCYELVVGHEKLVPPALASEVVVEGPSVSAYLERTPEGEPETGGIWFTDAETGMRVALAPEIGPKYNLPDPLWRTELRGDIFVPGLLEHQNTARAGLLTKYLMSEAWRKVCQFLSKNVSTKARELLDEEQAFGRDALSQAIAPLLDEFQRAFGLPEAMGEDGSWDTAATPRKKPEPSDKPRQPKEPSDKDKEPRKPGIPKPGEGKPRTIPIRIGDTDYAIVRKVLRNCYLAQVETLNHTIIYINIGEYVGMPKRKTDRAEHIRMAILHAVACDKFPDDSDQAAAFCGELRAQMNK